MIRAPDDATCPAHADEPAPTVCERCGVFMCRECSGRYAQDRCPKCRPKYGPSELDERRLGRVGKLAWLRCDVCGLEGPRFDRIEPVGLRTLLVAPFLGFISFGTFGLLYLLLAIGASKPMCPGCERSDGLEPSLKENLARPPGWDELTRQGTRMKVRNAVVVAISLVLVAAAAVTAFSTSLR